MGDIWYSEKSSAGWNVPILLPSPINTEFDESHPCFTNNGTIYFHSARGENSRDADIYRAKYFNNKFEEPERLDASINSSSFQAAPFISPDESYIIYFQKNFTEKTKSELCLSYKKGENLWTTPINLVAKLNLKADDVITAKLSPDGKYLFILDSGDVYWVSAKVIEELKPKELK